MADRAGNKSYAPRGVGEIVQFELADPAPGVQLSYVMPGAADAAKYIGRLLMVRFQFDTSAVVVDRICHLKTLHPDGINLRQFEIFAPETEVQAENLSERWVYQTGLPFHSAATLAHGVSHPVYHNICMPADIWILPGGELQSNIVDIDGGDQLSLMALTIQRWQVQ